MKKLLIGALLLLSISAAGWQWWKHSHPANGPLLLYGNVDIREVQLAFRQPGRVSTMLLDEGDSVVAGELMAQLEDRPYLNALAAAEASVSMAQAELDKLRAGPRPYEITQAREDLKRAEAVAVEAERSLTRHKKLYPSGASSQATLESAEAARDQARAGVSSAQAALAQAIEGYRAEDIAAGEARLATAQAEREQAITALADTRLVAPSDGTVITRIHEPGSMVGSQNSVYGLSLDHPVYVRAYISETELGRIAPGTQVWVTTDSSEKSYRGQIGFISPRAEFTPKTVETVDLRTDLVYRLRIVINKDDSDTALRQGMPVTISVDHSMATAGSVAEES